jgi:poly(glycerol-phosphate) alpha-glucosyltransferase
MRTLNTTVVTASASRLAGGLFSSVRRLHQTLSQDHGVNVQVLAFHDQYSAADLALWKPLRIETFPVSGPRQLGYSPGLRRAFLATNTDIGHTHGLWVYSSVATLDWHRKTGRPYLISPHGMLDPWAVRNSAWKKQLALLCYEREHLQHAACLRALCDAEARAIRSFGLKNPICTIPNGIDLPTGSAPPVAPWQNVLEPGRKVLLFLSRIHPKKGLVNLLKAWAKQLQSETGNRQLDAWVLAIAGWDQGGHEQELKQLATELGLAWTDIREQGNGERAEHRKRKGESRNGLELSARENGRGRESVVFLGPQFEAGKAACYHSCDAFVLPSFSEGLPMVVLEAWANSKPVLMTPECNLPEGFQAGAALQVAATEDSVLAGLSELRRLTDAERSAMGNRGHALVLNRFTWTQVANQMQAVHLWILGGGPKPDCILDA